jgi:hypothetical protein
VASADDEPVTARLLYHYTSTDGLVGILERRCLYASDVWFLNDASEVRYAQRRMVERLRERPELADDLSWLEELLDVGPRPGRLDNVFVTSFCEEGDLLSQWRGYAAGGFAIGFAMDGLATLADSQDGRRLVRVEYGREQGRRRLRSLFESIAERGPYEVEERERLARMIFLPEMACVKEPSFAEEREWRLLVVDERPEHLMFRAGVSGPVPYVEVALPEPTPVREVVIGPAAERELRRHGVEQLLARRGYAHVRVLQSESSLRG